MTETFRTLAGSVVGREHVRLGRNNQDGVAYRVEPELVVAVVTDGCSSSPSSEVGARLGAAWLVGHAGRLWRRDRDRFRESLHWGLMDFLDSLASRLDPRGDQLTDVVDRFLLFGYLLALMDGEETLVLGVGDGVISVNGVVRVLDPGADNAPPYPAYGLLPPRRIALPSASLETALHLRIPTAEVDELIVATDGARGLLDPYRVESEARSLLSQALVGHGKDRPLRLQKCLNVLGERRGLLTDDTSMVALVRRELS